MSLTGNLAKAATSLGAGAFKSGLLGNMGMGAASGAVIGAANPMGNDGILRGGFHGALWGAGLGAAGYGGARVLEQNGKRSLKLGSFSLGTKSGLVSSKLPGRSRAIRAGNIGLYVGALGGAIGGSKRRQARGRNTTIASNSWKNGTHPMYFT